MLTYLDMITLLFVTFVVLYAMSKVDSDKFSALAESLSASFATTATEGRGAGVGPGKIVTSKPAVLPAVPLQSKRPHSPLYDKAYDILKSAIQAKRLEIRQEERGIVIQLGAQLFFKSGSAELPEGAMDTFGPIADMIATLPNLIQVEGYADDVNPQSAEGFKDNWELSSKRALNILGILRDSGIDGSRMSAAAYGDSHPLVSNETEEGRAYNRQVNIVILYSANDR